MYNTYETIGSRPTQASHYNNYCMTALENVLCVLCRYQMSNFYITLIYNMYNVLASSPGSPLQSYNYIVSDDLKS